MLDQMDQHFQAPRYFLGFVRDLLSVVADHNAAAAEARQILHLLANHLTVQSPGGQFPLGEDSKDLLTSLDFPLNDFELDLKGIFSPKYTRTPLLFNHEGFIQSTPLPAYNSAISSTALSVYLNWGEKASSHDLDITISKIKESMDEVNEDQVNYLTKIQSLGYAYLDKYVISRAPPDLEKARALLQKAVDMAHLSPKDEAKACFDLAVIHTVIFEDLEASGPQTSAFLTSYEVDQVIGLLQRSSETSPVQYPMTVIRSIFLGTVFLQKAAHTKSSVDLEASMEAFRVARTCAMESHPVKGYILRQLAVFHFTESMMTSNVDHLQTAIQYHQHALETFPELRQPKILYDTGYLYHRRWDFLGNPKDLDAAMVLYQEGLDHSDKNSNDRRSLISGICDAYVIRCEMSNAMADLEAAIDLCKEGLDLAEEHDGITCRFMGNLGTFLWFKHSKTKHIEDLNGGIEKLRVALNIRQTLDSKTPASSHNRVSDPMWNGDSLNSALANAYRSRFLIIKDLADIDESIRLYRIILSENPDTSIRCITLLNTAYVYRDRYTVSHSPSDFEQATKYGKGALDETPSHHPLRCRVLGLSADLLHQNITPENMDTRAIIGHLEQGLDSPNSFPMDRIAAGLRVFRLCQPYDWNLSARIMSKAISLIPLVSPHSMTNLDRQDMLKELAGIGSHAAVLLFANHRSPYEMIDILEQSRGLMRISLATIRADLKELEQSHHELASKYAKLRQILDVTSSMTGGSVNIPQQTQIRYTTGQELEETLKEIRRQPGFQRFQLPPSEASMKAAAALGPIVIINVSILECQAIIIESEKIQVLRLHRISLEKLKARARTLSSGGVETIHSRYSLLEWLWRMIVKPILAVLGIDGPPKHGIWPRICWVPTGVAAKFPLHAAGLHLSDGADTLMDRAISMYATSVTTVVENRLRRVRGLPEVKPKKISICMQVSKPEPPLHADVVAALEQCDIFHFAGHGMTAANPAESALVLDDKVLSVSTLFDINLSRKKPFLAYLSACGTGRVDHDKLVDESTHLISAFQLAGFKNVIGTLWDVADAFCVDISAQTYEWIMAHGMSHESVAEGLHHTCKKFRDQWASEEKLARMKDLRAPVMREIVDAQGDSLLPWVPFVLYSD